MASTLIIAEDAERGRAKAVELLQGTLGERAFIWVPLLGEDPASAPAPQGYQRHHEAVILGSRLAQLSSWVDAVIAEGLERWAQNLHQRYPGNLDKIDSERISLVAVLDSAMADLVLITRAPGPPGGPGPADLLRRTIDSLRAKIDAVIEL
ncbi:MAG: hypothetical protein U1E76_09255 [Planctomycetota bacterium]